MGRLWGSASILLALTLLTACAPASPEVTTPGAIEVTDQLGRTIRLEKIPQRIISLAPSNTKILFTLGLKDRVVGVTEYCN